jgi:hypothetical protein
MESLPPIAFFIADSNSLTVLPDGSFTSSSAAEALIVEVNSMTAAQAADAIFLKIFLILLSSSRQYRTELVLKMR